MTSPRHSERFAARQEGTTMHERTRMMIEAYIPSPPDPTLGFNEYYYLQSTWGGDRVIRVHVSDIYPYRDGTEYGIYQSRGGRDVRIDVGYGDPFRGARMCDLYDNKQDCRDRTHSMYDGWQSLRAAQEKEGVIQEL